MAVSESLEVPLERANRRTDIAGAGLGLFVVRRLIHAHGGRIEVESREGIGTSFSVSLPRVRQVGREVQREPGASQVRCFRSVRPVG